MNKHARRVSQIVRKQNFFASAISAALIVLVVVVIAEVPRTAHTSPEVKFSDASASGLSIVPASCPSTPDFPGQCDAAPAPTPTCPDGSQAPNSDPNQCTCAQGNSSVCPAPVPAPSATFTANGSQFITIAAGSSITYVWNATNAVSAHSSFTVDTTDSCGYSAGTTYNWGVTSLSGSSSGAPLPCQIGHSYTITYFVDNSVGEERQSSVIVQVTAPPAPDLTASSVTPTFATTGSETVFSATITNTGNASTGSGFSDLLQVATDPSGSGAYDLDSYDSAALGAGQSNTASFAETFPTPATYYLRVCADKSSAQDPGVITESDENDNCGAWSAVTVGAAASCPDGSIAPGNNPGACTCASGNTAACTSGTCPDGSSAPNGDSNECTCAHGNAAACGGGTCTSPTTCQAPTAIPGCRIVTAPQSARAGNTIQVGWASACATAAAGCTSFGLPETAGSMILSENAGGIVQSLGAVQPSATAVAVPSSVPATFTLSGQLYAGYWPLIVPVSGSTFSCQTTVQPIQSTCSDGSAPINGICPNNNNCPQTGYPSCSADGSSIEYLNSACHVKSSACQWAAQGYGCVSGACLTPPEPTGSFGISPKLVRPGSTATISWQIGPSTTCALTATDGDNSSLSGSGSKLTAPILGQTVYTMTCTETLTGESAPPQSVTVDVVPGFIEI
jgi:hypothetical protein